MWKGWEEKSLSTCLIPKPYIISSHFSLMISRLQRTEIHGIEITAPKFTQLKKAAGIGSQHCWSHSCLPLDILVHAHVCCQWWVLNCQVPPFARFRWISKALNMGLCPDVTHNSVPYSWSCNSHYRWQVSSWGECFTLLLMILFFLIILIYMWGLTTISMDLSGVYPSRY